MADKKNMLMILVILAIVAFLVFGLSGKLAPGRVIDADGNAKSTLEVTPPEPGPAKPNPQTSGVTGASIKILPPR